MREMGKYQTQESERERKNFKFTKYQNELIDWEASQQRHLHDTPRVEVENALRLSFAKNGLSQFACRPRFNKRGRISGDKSVSFATYGFWASMVVCDDDFSRRRP